PAARGRDHGFLDDACYADRPRDRPCPPGCAAGRGRRLPARRGAGDRAGRGRHDARGMPGRGRGLDEPVVTLLQTLRRGRSGYGYSQIIPGQRGAVDLLRLLHPDRVEPKLNGTVLTYKVLHGDGSSEILNAEDVFHMTGLSLDGVTGLSVIAYARETIGLSLA